MEKASPENSTEMESADGSWGWLDQYEKYSRPGDSAADFKLITYEESMDKYRDYMHAAHAMYFSRRDKIVWDLYNTRASIMMHMRFDGMLGFPGGLVEKGEEPVKGLNRELEEEICIDLARHAIELKDRLTTHLHEDKELVLHFFAKEIPLEDFRLLEERALNADEYGVETYGTVLPPLFTMGDNFRGFPAFLKNLFCGNAREQLLIGIAAHKLLTKEEIDKAVKSSLEHRR